MLRVGEHEPAEAATPGCKEFALLHQIRGKEDHDQHLRGLPGLEVDRADVHPQPRAVDLGAHAGHEWQKQRGDAEHEEGVSVALEDSNPAHDHEREHKRPDCHRSPYGLNRCQMTVRREIAIESGDGEVADAVEHQRERQQCGIGARREAPQREMRGDEQAQHHGEEDPEVGRKRGVAGERDKEIAAAGDDHRQEPEAELLSTAATCKGLLHRTGAAGGGTPAMVVGVVVVVVGGSRRA